MKITDVKTVLLTGPLTNDPSLLTLRKLRSAAFIEIHTDTELVGIGETYAGYHAPEIVPEIVDFFKPILIGLNDDDIQPLRLWDRMYHCGNFWARTGVGVNVLAGIEGALWDLRGKMDRQPVYQLLGGRRHDRLLSYATGSVSNYPWSDLIEKINRYRDAGFRAAKFGAGWYNASSKEVFTGRTAQEWVDMESDKLQTIRRQIGKDFTLCLDGHMSNVQLEGTSGWDVGIARAVLNALEPYDIFFYEEPLNYDDVEGYAELCRGSTIPIAGGECLNTRQEFQQYAKIDGFDIAQPDASYTGIGAFLDIARMFAMNHKRVATHAWSSGAGVMANIHAAFATPNMAILELPPLAGPLHTEVYAEGYRFEDGYILPPETPGLGVRLTEQTKAKYPFIRGSGEWNAVPGKSQYL
jgi:galactonate dehydratase